MLDSVIVHTLASLGLVAIGFCVTFTILTIYDEFKK